MATEESEKEKAESGSRFKISLGSVGLEGLKRFLGREAGEAEEVYSPDEHGQLISYEVEEGYELVDRYWVNEPFARVHIVHDLELDERFYHVVEPVLDGFESRVVERVKDRMRDVILSSDFGEESEREAFLVAKAEELLDKMAIEVDPAFRAKVRYYLVRDFLGYGLIDPFMHDSRIEDVSCDGPEVPVYLFHKAFSDLETNVVFEEEAELNSFIIKLAQRSGHHISRANPMVDASLPDGSRIQMTLGREVTTRGSTFTIRKFSDIPLNPVDLIAFNTYSPEMMAYTWLAVENNKSILFVGGTASGKTTSMNASSLFITPRSKIVTIEDTRELNLPFENWIPGVTRESFGKEAEGSIEMYDLLRAALRQRPEYLLVGEVRGEEAVVLFQAMSTGHTTFSTMHADSVDTAIHRLENPPINVPRSMIASLDTMSIQAQVFVDGERVRRVMEFVEVGELDPRSKTIHTNPIYRWDPTDDTFTRVGESTVLQDIRKMHNWSQGELEIELDRRQRILESMMEEGIRDYEDVVDAIQSYYTDPGQLMDRLASG